MYTGNTNCWVFFFFYYTCLHTDSNIKKNFFQVPYFKVRLIELFFLWCPKEGRPTTFIYAFDFLK